MALRQRRAAGRVRADQVEPVGEQELGRQRPAVTEPGQRRALRGAQRRAADERHGPLRRRADQPQPDRA